MISGLGNTSSLLQNNGLSLDRPKDYDGDFHKTKTHFKSTSRNFSMNIPKGDNSANSKKIYKDPEVWDLPE